MGIRIVKQQLKCMFGLTRQDGIRHINIIQ